MTLASRLRLWCGQEFLMIAGNKKMIAVASILFAAS
jgi:hypothetical protein